MVVTRDFPKKLLDEQELGTCKVVWLTNLVGEGRINPTAIGILMGQIRTFIETNPKSVAIIDGIEYLISLNTYDRMLQFMHQLRDVVVTHESILFVPLDPRTLSQRELALFERSMEPIVPRSENEVSDETMLHQGEEGVLRLLDVRPR
jgi:archaellum biogenesis ATPase FlaH